MNDSKAAFREEAALNRGDLTDAEWRIFDPLLPDRGERGPPVEDKRRTVNGILWVLRTGAPWRDMPKRYGNWNSVFVRFTRWSKLGVWDAAFETLASLGPPADEEHAIDSTIVRAHQHAAGAKGGIKRSKRSADRAAASRPKSISARMLKAILSPSN
jgi:transposase